MAKPRKKLRSIVVGQTYGVGSLRFRPRVVTALVEGGRIVHWMALPPQLVSVSPRARASGKIYACTRRAFVLWLAAVTAELESYDTEHTRRLAGTAPSEVGGD